MKKIILLAAISFLLMGCNMNPNKETRLQKLEAEMQQSINSISAMESSIRALEAENEQLKARLLELEK